MSVTTVLPAESTTGLHQSCHDLQAIISVHVRRRHDTTVLSCFILAEGDLSLCPQLHTQQAPKKTTTQLLHVAAPLNLGLINPECYSIPVT